MIDEIILNTFEGERHPFYVGAFRSIQEAFEDGGDEAAVAEVEQEGQEYPLVLTIGREGWKDLLTDAMNFFAEVEHYELAAEVKKLIEKL